MTRLGQVYVKSNTDTTIPEHSHSFKLAKINPAWMVSCWKDSNKCVFAGESELNLWYVGSDPSKEQVFSYGDKNNIRSNKFQAVRVIPDTDYFFAGDYKNLSITRWISTDATQVAEYQVGGDEASECETLIYIRGTPLLLVGFDNSDPIIVLDITSMSLTREINGASTYDESKCDQIDYYTAEFRLVCAQQLVDDSFEINLYNYSDGTTVSNYAGPPLSAVMPGEVVVHTVSAIEGAPFFIVVFKFNILFLRMSDKDTMALAQAQISGSANNFQTAQWFAPENYWLVTLVHGQELIRAIQAPFCSPECTGGAGDNCEADQPFFSEGCTTCTDGAKVGGKCPQPDPAFGVLDKTFTNGNAEFSTTNNIKVTDTVKFDSTPDAGSIVLNQKLETVEDPE